MDRELRELSIRCAAAGSTAGLVLYNVGVQVHTNTASNCDPTETMDVQSHLSAHFDRVVNTNPQFRDLFHLNTNFCNDSPSSRLLEAADGEERQLELRISAHHFSLQLARWGDGKCYLCNPFNSDDRRRNLQGGDVVMDDIDFFHHSSSSMEAAINAALTTELQRTYNTRTGHCLCDQDPTVEAHLVVAQDRGSLTDCQGSPSLYCCAPKSDPTNVCSQAAFGGIPYCHVSEENCRICDGLWVDSFNPPKDCLGFWQPCKDGGTCCPPATCHEFSPWYSQCLDRS